MGKFLLAIVIGLVGAAIVHIAVIFTMPRVAENNAWGRLSRLGEMYDVVRVEVLRSEASGPVAQAEGSDQRNFAFIDPAFVTASCRFSLAGGPVHLFAGERTGFWSASIYNSEGDNLYSINDRSAVAGEFDLLVGTPEQIVDAKANATDRDETSIPVEVQMSEGYLTLRALVDEETKRPSVDAFVRSLVCEPPSPATAGLDRPRAS